MLNAQRDRSNPTLEHRTFARGFAFLHFAASLVMVALLLFHEMWLVSLSVLVWFLASVGLVAGMMLRQEWCRPLLAALFFLLAAAGAVYVTKSGAAVLEGHPPLLSHKLLPLWGTVAILSYVVGGVVLLTNKHLARATARGFSLW